MKGRPKKKGILVIALIAVLAVGGMPLTVAAATEKPDHFAYIAGYPDGEVRPLDRITREETAMIFYRLLTPELREKFVSAEQPFPDVGGERWSKDAIASLYHAGIIKGYSDENFLPEKPVTRAEFATMAARFAMIGEKTGQPAEPRENKRSDTEIQESEFPYLENHWAYPYINTAVEKGWIHGYGDGTFRPDHFIIRCEAMMLVNDALDRRVNLTGLCGEAKQWPDNTEDKWYYEIVEEATNTHDYERADRPKSTERWTEVRPDPIW